MALDFNITHETADLSEYASTFGGDVAVTTAAALTGTYGLSVPTTSGSTEYVTADITDESSHDVNYRFKLDPNSLTMTSGDSFFLLVGRRSAGQALHTIELDKNGANYRLRAGCAEDGGVIQYHDSWHIITDAVHTIEYQMRGASSSSADDGTLTLYIDDSSVEAKGNYQVFTISKAVDVDIGVTQSGDPGTSGTFYIDDFAGDMTGTYIGLVGNAPMVTGPSLIYSALTYSEPMSGITVADADNDLADIRYDCTSGKGIFTIDALDTALISAGTNNTNDVTISGTNAQLLAAHARVVYKPQQLGTDSAVRVTATDDLAATDNLVFSIETWDHVIEGTTQTILNNALASLTATSTVPVSGSISVKAIDSAALSVTDSATITTTLSMLAGIHSKRKRRRRS